MARTYFGLRPDAQKPFCLAWSASHGRVHVTNARAVRCRYFNDLWQFDIESLKWEQISRPGAVPAPRGGCQMVVAGDVLYLFGGHSVAVEADRSETETV